ncbi:DNA topoisomerase IB [Puia sp. P3]|uniref:DNA topoisomerase IB n=1 Tax=Puia sp. P3 TaxID=3423952 RepID=UPI003D67A13F
MNTGMVLSHKALLQVDRDYEKAASVVHLRYVSDSGPGIGRVKRGKGYCYLLDGKPVKDVEELGRIKSLAIPPSWTSVWICPAANGHIQATGLDLRGRKQYRYHAKWNSLRTETKFHRLYEFGKALPLLRKKIDADMRQKEVNQDGQKEGSGDRQQALSRDRVLATVLSLMERTYIRVGNNEYEKANGSYGLTTLKNKHVAISGDRLVFSFPGKKGVRHDITLRNKRLARAVSLCKEIPGAELFQYYAEDGTRHGIDSGMVNQYIKDATGMDFTAKDFRTWAGSLHALRAFAELGEACSEAECKKNVVAVFDAVSRELGNTRAVCKKYYVHPGLVQLYEENKLNKYLSDAGGTEEEVLMKILQKYIRVSPLG